MSQLPSPIHAANSSVFCNFALQGLFLVFTWIIKRRRISLGKRRDFSLVQVYQDEPESPVWYPRTSVDCDFVQEHGVKLAARLVKRQMRMQQQPKLLQEVQGDSVPYHVQGRFRDMTCETRGEELLESIFIDYESLLILEGVDVDERLEQKICELKDDVLAAAVMVVQSLLVLATQVGLTGHPEQLRKLVAHLDDRFDTSLAMQDLESWNSDSIRRLKYRVDRTPAIELLGTLLYKRTPQGAFDLLLEMRVFTKHEDLALLRSGFPIHFSRREIQAAEIAAKNPKEDVDALLGIRRDLRHLKMFTIDGASTSEIDDGVSVEIIRRDGGATKQRYWIHIADAERHMTTELWDNVARKRFTSLYLPTGTFPMLPSTMSSDAMSLIAGQDACALSMGVELNEDGSIDPSSVLITPSLIRVDYRLTYEDADEMLSEGVAYQEEWELGALFDMATRRRNYRVRNGSIEGVVRKPIPFSTITAYKDRASPDGIGISLSVDVSHNAGRNQTVVDETDDSNDDCTHVSDATLLVTESMIVAGEGIGIWKENLENGRKRTLAKKFPNSLSLPYRTQPSPDFKSRAREHGVARDLLKYNVGGGYCYTWYARRFLQSLKIADEPGPHSGLGLRSYVQWTSPIRRYSDLLTHRTIKRCLRRERAYVLIEQEQLLPVQLRDSDFGFPDGTLTVGVLANMSFSRHDLDQDTNPLEGLGLQGAARTLQRQSQQYWLYEYLRRLSTQEPDRTYMALVLGAVDPERRRYAIFVEELGLEHRYTSPAARLDPGAKLRLRIDTVNPRFGVLTFVREI
ncbi:hypothetical protein MPSEU_000793300 [Mayamaea pseudoterrestris]|nr:hypothetical protein MPSEU_000793300 [Mayamaea pseudoterrestris]